MPFRGERECPFEVRERRGSIESERTFAGEGEEPQRRCLELASRCSV